ncbi:hypothetical protein AB0M61_43370 [Streptomyces sp. NPDC051642]|uniref:hypothetical protein n=1 Tax=Streptomyces sp. NPDC051642 TaxID=3154646 RepID=UPI00343CB6FF
MVRCYNAFAQEYSWHWSASAMDEWTTYPIAELHRAQSTIRNYQAAVRLFCNYVTSPHYQWPQECELRFGTHPVQICHEWNSAAHLVDYEGEASRRPMTRGKIRCFLDYADAQVGRAVRLGRKGALAAYRDATVFKVIYGWGLGCAETSKLGLADWYRNLRATELGRFGSLHVRWGKRAKGSPPKRRTVLPTCLLAGRVRCVCCRGGGLTVRRQ